MNHSTNVTTDVVVIGGGLAGLTTAVYLAKSGKRVTVLEKARRLGGLAQTQVRDGFHFNMGPHAVYVGGAAYKVFKELGVPLNGRKPIAPAHSFGLQNGRLHLLPGTPGTLLRTTLFSGRQKLAMLPALAAILRTNPRSVAHQSASDWLAANVPEGVRPLLAMVGRLSTYANAPQLSAEVLLQQLQMALKDNVLYLDGGWQTLVDALRQQAAAAGVTLATGVRATAVHENGDVAQVTLADGRTLTATAVVVATPPQAADALLPDVSPGWGETAVPVRAACLNVGLRRLPRPDRVLVLPLDQPLYLSVHSHFAQLAPGNGTTIHLAKYLAVDEAPSAADRQALSHLLDLAQPGWREQLVTEQFLPEMAVVSRLVTAADGGLNGRPAVQLSGHARIFLAGDWVGNEGWLADASLASARRAAQHIAAQWPSIVPLAKSATLRQEVG